MYRFFKRLFDLVLAINSFGILLPFFLVISIVIKLDSKGPVFYRGERVGRLGRIFRIWKFRTMHPNAELVSTTTGLDDPRITRVGRFLRKYKLDEFPQLVNVIQGDMSIVGPRPEVQEHTKEYNEEEKSVLAVMPGITDYSSIHFASLDKMLGSDNPHQMYITKIRSEKNRLRIKYVQNQCFIEDMKIIFWTVVAILKKVGKK